MLVSAKIRATSSTIVQASARPIARHPFTNRDFVHVSARLHRATPEDKEEVDDVMEALDDEEYREIFDPTNQIPGGFKDAMSSKTELGSAVREACDELDTLRGLETDVIQQAEDLLKGIGYQGSLFSAGDDRPPEGDV